MQIAVVDLEIGNLRSVHQALSTVAPDAQITITRNPDEIAQCDKLVLPGQGAIGTWFAYLNKFDLKDAVANAFANKPVLGICVGMQAMFSHSDEDGGVQGLGLFEGQVAHFADFHSEDDSEFHLKIPQMGWNQVNQSSHPLWAGIEDGSHFYFVHSYCANLTEGADSSVVYGTADYGHEFVAAVGRDNVFAVQFHPEKSHDDGLQLLKNFSQWDGRV
jgi:glutamine amidotransferase